MSTLSYGLAGSIALLTGVATAAQGHRLNGPLSRAPDEWVYQVQVSPDGRWALYSTVEEGSPGALYSVPVDGGRAAVRLFGRPFGWSGEVSADSRYVLFGSGDELDSVPIDGSRGAIPLARGALLGHALTPDGKRVVVAEDGLSLVAIHGGAPPVRISTLAGVPLRVSPDGARVVFRARPAGAGELTSVRLDGGGDPARLSGTIPGATIQDDFALTADGENVLFRADADGDRRFELYTVPSDGHAAPLELELPSTVTDASASSLVLDPRGRRVLFLGDREKLYCALADGSGPVVRLNEGLQHRDVADFRFTPGGRWVLFLSEVSRRALRFDLYLAPVDGSSPPRKLNGALVAGGSVHGYDVDAATQRVFYLADQDAPGDDALYRVPLLRATTPVRLTPPGLEAHGRWWRLSPDGTRLVYRVLEAGTYHLYGLSSDGSGSPVLLSAAPIDSLSVYDAFEFGAEGKRVVYPARALGAYATELFGAPLDGAAPARLSAPLATGEIVGDVTWFAPLAGGERLAFVVQGDYPGDEVPDQLYSVRADGSEPPTQILAGPNAEELWNGQPSGDGRWLVFTTRGCSECEDVDLRSAPVDGSGPVVVLNGSFENYGIGSYTLTPAGDQVIFTTFEGGSLHGLYIRNVDGSGDARALEDPSQDYPWLLRVTADARRLLYLSPPAWSGTSALHSLPLDGSSDSVRIDGPLVAGGSVRTYELTPDGSRAVYLADQLQDEVLELFSVPTDGSAPAVRVSGALVAGGDVYQDLHGFVPRSFALTPDGARVVYLADQEEDERFELFSAPVDGSAAPVKLNGVLVAGGDVRTDAGAAPLFALTPDGTRVAYLADQETDGHVELFVAPLDGHAPARKLSRGEFVATSDEPLQVSPDGARVVYRAHPGPGPRMQLFAALLDGSGAPVRLDAAAGDQVGAFRISPDGRRVAYVAGSELFAVAIAGGVPPERVNGTLVPGGSVTRPYYGSAFAFHPDSTRVYYIADQSMDEVHELYLSVLGKWAR
jgi:Tol biopolymer transport system component